MSSTQAAGKKPNVPNPNTPAASAKGAPAKLSASAKKAEAAAPDSAAAIAKDDATKAIDKLEIKLKAINANNVARVANSHLSTSDDKLHPFMSLKTGKLIEKFPATSKEIQKLSLVVVDSVLGALDADRTGNEEVKRERLRLQIGLRPHPA